MQQTTAIIDIVLVLHKLNNAVQRPLLHFVQLFLYFH